MFSDTYPNREYKDALFRFIFNNPEDLLSLYNAVNDTDYDDVSGLTVTTLKDVVYLSYKNDISFILGSQMSLYEHQSSFNPNMPVRGLVYFGQLYSQYIHEEGLDIYVSELVKLPVPQYIVFYNGLKKEPERCELKLSDAFSSDKEGVKPCIELTAVMLNINLGNNIHIMERCGKLREYSQFISLVRGYLSEGNYIKIALELAIKDAISNNILKEILLKQRAEVCKMFLTEYDEEQHLKNVMRIGFKEGREEGYNAGRQEGIKDGIKEGMKEGIKEGMKEGINAIVKESIEYGQNRTDIVKKLIKYFDLSEYEAEEYFEKYSK